MKYLLFTYYFLSFVILFCILVPLVVVGSFLGVLFRLVIKPIIISFKESDEMTGDFIDSVRKYFEGLKNESN